jgi:hypothetical protein
LLLNPKSCFETLCRFPSKHPIAETEETPIPTLIFEGQVKPVNNLRCRPLNHSHDETLVRTRDIGSRRRHLERVPLNGREAPSIDSRVVPMRIALKPFDVPISCALILSDFVLINQNQLRNTNSTNIVRTAAVCGT